MSQAAPPAEPTELQKEVQRRVGRSLLLFQQIEGLMKLLLVRANVTMTQSEGSSALARQTSLQKQTMGQLREQFFEELIDAPPGDEETVDKALQEVRLTMRIRLMDGAGGDEIKQYQEEFGAIIEARNELVHHFLSRFNLATDEGCTEALAYLEAQRERALKLYAHLKSAVDGMQKSLREVAAFWDSDEGQRQFDLMLLQSSRLIAHLAETAKRLARPDGWVPLSSAGQVLSREAPEQLDRVKTQFGQRTLKGIVIASELFDVLDEATPGGGLRTLYRVKNLRSMPTGKGS